MKWKNGLQIITLKVLYNMIRSLVQSRLYEAKGITSTEELL